jgi:hypothetical protein
MGAPQKGRADYLALGDYNVACSMCGRKRKASELVRNWQGLYRCPEHNEPRQPQDFARGIKEVISPPWAQIETDNYVTFTPTFPATIFPSPIKLIMGVLAVTDELYFLVLDQNGLPITSESGYNASGIVLVPNWVIPETYTWSWKSGGVGITINDPATNIEVFLFSSASAPLSGVLQCTITDSLGGVATVTVNVST